MTRVLIYDLIIKNSIYIDLRCFIELKYVRKNKSIS